MNKQETTQRLALIESETKELKKIIEAPKRTREQVFLEMIDGLTIKIDKEKYSNSILFFKDDKFFIEIEKSTIWVSYKYIWLVFESEFQMNYGETHTFLDDMMEKYFKIKGVMPTNY